MVRLDRIYTRSGDSGKTSLADGTRVSKLDERIVAGGSVDELNSLIGVAIACDEQRSVCDLLEMIQQRLFDLGADISCPWHPDTAPAEDRCLRTDEQHVTWLESQIDLVIERLEPLTSFVLPGGTQLAAALHTARSVCRRAERAVLRLQLAQTINPQIAVYLNRLSDLLFVLARAANDNGRTDVLWKPGR